MAFARIITRQSVGLVDNEMRLASVALLGAHDPGYLEVVEHGRTTENRGTRKLGYVRAGVCLAVYYGDRSTSQAQIRAAQASQGECEEQQSAHHQHDEQGRKERLVFPV